METQVRQFGTAGMSYAERDANLHSLGYSDYAHYLRCDTWRRLRKDVIACGYCFCGALAAEVHHLNYSLATLLGKDRSGLRRICSKHHRLIEFNGDGDKRTLVNANVEYFRLERSYSHQPAVAIVIPYREPRNYFRGNLPLRLSPVRQKSTSGIKAPTRRKERLLQNRQKIHGLPQCERCGCFRETARADGVCTTCKNRQRP